MQSYAQYQDKFIWPTLLHSIIITSVGRVARKDNWQDNGKMLDPSFPLIPISCRKHVPCHNLIMLAKTVEICRFYYPYLASWLHWLEGWLAWLGYCVACLLSALNDCKLQFMECIIVLRKIPMTFIPLYRYWKQ